MQLECEERSGAHATARRLRQTDSGQEPLEPSSARFLVETAILRKPFYSVVERDGLLALEFLTIVEADRKFGPDSEGMPPQHPICQYLRQVVAKYRRQLRLHIFDLQPIIRRPLKGLVDNSVSTD